MSTSTGMQTEVLVLSRPDSDEWTEAMEGLKEKGRVSADRRS